MVYGFENKNVNIEQISDICKKQKYGSFTIAKIYITELYKRNTSGRIIPPEYEEDGEEQLLNDVKDGDIVITSTLANFSTVINGMLRSLDQFMNKGVRVISIHEDFDSTTETGIALQRVSKLLDLYQKNCFKSRFVAQKEGIARAQEEGKYAGRKALSPSDIPLFDRYYREYMARLITKEVFAEKVGVSRPTLDKLIRLYTYQKRINDIYIKKRLNESETIL